MKAAISSARRLLGSGALVATGTGLFALAVHDRHWIAWSIAGSAGVVGAAGIALARRSLVAQIFGRAAAWVVFAPSALVAFITTVGAHMPDPVMAALAAGSGAALLLSRPMLHTPEAQTAFAPSRFRSWLLAGATASTATAMTTSFLGLDFLHRTWSTNFTYGGAGLLVLAAALLGSAFGVLRMRTWGILLGVLTSFVVLGASAVLQDVAAVGLSLTAIPGLLFFLLPIVIARRDRAAVEIAPPVRVSPGAVELPHRVRIALHDEIVSDDELPARLQQQVGSR